MNSSCRIIVVTVVLAGSGGARGETYNCKQYDFRTYCSALEPGTQKDSLATIRARLQESDPKGIRAPEKMSISEVKAQCQSDCRWFNTRLQDLCWARAKGIDGSSSTVTPAGYSDAEVRLLQAARRAYDDLLPHYRKSENPVSTFLEPCQYNRGHFTPIARANDVVRLLGVFQKGRGVAALTPEAIAQTLNLLAALESRCRKSEVAEVVSALASLGKTVGSRNGITLYENLKGGPAGDLTGYTGTIDERLRRAGVFDRAEVITSQRVGSIRTCTELACALSIHSLPGSNADVTAFERRLGCRRPGGSARGDDPLDPSAVAQDPARTGEFHF